MINASKNFREKLNNGGSVVNYADVTLSDGTDLHLEPKDIMIGGCSIEDKTTDGKFGIGFAVGKTLSLKIANHDEQFSMHDFYQSKIIMYAAMKLDDGTVEKIRKGTYYAVTPQTPGDIIEISAVDAMYKLDRDYAESATVYPASLQAILTGACMDCGIPIGFGSFDNDDFVVQEKPENATYRQVVSWACQIAGYNARIDNGGYMALVWYDRNLLSVKNYRGGEFKAYENDAVVDGGNFTDYSADAVLSGGSFADAPEHIFRVNSIEVSTDEIAVTGVRVLTGSEVSELAGVEGYLLEIKDNQLASGKEREVAEYLNRRLNGMAFRRFSAEITGNPLYEPFDVVTISDRKGNAYTTILNSVSWKAGGFTRVACEAEDPERNGSVYSSSAATAVTEARRNLEKKISEYDKAVQGMNELAMNALGFFETVSEGADGSRITYMHDKPNLSESRIVYKRGIDGFFVSQDGGSTYTAGFDGSGNAVVNVIYAIGIVADWINSGRFVCQKDGKTTFLADVDTGEVRITPDYFALSSGETIDSISKKQAQSVLKAETQESVFNKLTKNGESEGFYLENGNLYVNASYIRSGTLTLGGTNDAYGSLRILDASGGEIGSWNKDGIRVLSGSFQNKTSTSGASLYGGRLHLTNEDVDVGFLGTNYSTEDPSNKGIVFDLNVSGAYTCWAAQEKEGGNYYIKLLYASKDFSNYEAGKLHAGCDMNFRGYKVQNALLAGCSFRESFHIPNNVECNIYSNVDFHQWEIKNARVGESFSIINDTKFDIYSDVDFHRWSIKNAKIDGLDSINGAGTWTGSIPILHREFLEDGSEVFYTTNFYVRDGIITRVPF